MRLLYASERPLYPFRIGGAVRSSHQLLSAIRDKLDYAAVCCGLSASAAQSLKPSDYEALGVTEFEERPESIRLKCGHGITALYDFYPGYTKHLNEGGFDIVWSELEGARTILNMAGSRRCARILYVHDAVYEPHDVVHLAGAGAEIVCISPFIRRHLFRTSGVNAEVIYPLVGADVSVPVKSNGYVTFINPVPEKGIEVASALAGLMPRQPFLFVEGWPVSDYYCAELSRRLKPLGNVRFITRRADIREVFGETRVLIVPSVWEEAAARVVREAQMSGIPVLVSARGGLPETVGDGGIVVDDYTDPALWKMHLELVLSDPCLYDTLSKRALENVRREEFCPVINGERFLSVCSRAVRRMERMSALGGDQTGR